MVSELQPPLFIAHDANGHVIRGSGDQFNAGRGWLRCGCGLSAPARLMEVKSNPKKRCGPQCQQARGITCHCACIGTNHGKALTY